MECIWQTTQYTDGVRLVKQSRQELAADEGQELHAVNVYPKHTYQKFMGFGGALTEACAYTFAQMPPDRQQELLDLYFGEDGMGYCQLRMSIDSCDASLDNYSAMQEDDPSFAGFSIARDEQYILPFLRAVKAHSKRPVQVMLSPWSPPPFMKTNGEKNHGGQLKREYYEMWAQYLCRYILAYEKTGCQVNRISVQNEPMATQIWDSCRYSAQEEKEFLRDYLYPAMKQHGLREKGIFIWDHNKERALERAEEILDEVTDKMVAGIAFHWYSGDHFENVQMLHETYPDKLLAFTEGCVEYSRHSHDNPLAHARMYAHDYIGNLNAGANIMIEWNLLLDAQGGPNHVQNYCEAPVMYDVEADRLDCKLSLDYIAHMSRYIPPQSVRLGTSKYTRDIDVTAFKRPDGKIAVVLLNLLDTEQEVFLRIEGKLAGLLLPGDAIGTALLQ